MFENYFNLEEKKLNIDDLGNLIFKQLIVYAFEDNEEKFDLNLSKLKSNNISLFNVFTIDAEYAGNLDGNGSDVFIEKIDSDYSSFIQACVLFIDDEKYLKKIVNHLNKEEVLKNMSDMTPFLLNLLDRNKKDAFFEIMKSGLLTEKEIKLDLISPNNAYYFVHRKEPFYKLEIEFLSNHFHELNISKSMQNYIDKIVAFILENANTKQFKNFSESVLKTDFKNVSESNKQDIFKKLFEYGILNENQLIGMNKINEDMTVDLKSFLKISDVAMLNLKELQVKHFEERLNKVDNNIKEKKSKI